MANYEYPLTKFFFKVEWGDKLFGGFQEVTGLEMTREKAEYRHGLDPKFVKRQIPGMKTYGELTLKRGVFAGDNHFFSWWNGDVKDDPDGMPERRDLTITLYNSAQKPIMVWNVEAAWPTKVTSTDLNADNNEIAVESIVLCHEGIRVTNKE